MYALCSLQSLGIRKPQVQQANVGPALRKTFKALLQGLAQDELEAHSSNFRESFLQQPRIAGIVLYKQNLRREWTHGSFSLSGV